MGITITKPNYQGTELQDFLTKTFYKKNAIDRFTLLPNVKSKFSANSLNFSGNVLGNSACNFVPNVNTDLTEKSSTVETYDINFEECIEKFEQSYLAATLKAGAMNVDLPASFEEWLLSELPNKIGDELERKAFTELVAEMTGDADVIDVALAPITTANAITELGKVYDAIPGDLFGDEDLVIFMNFNNYKKYQQDAINISVPELLTDGVKMSYLGIEIVPVPNDNASLGGGLPDSKIIAGLMSNFIRATDLVSDDTTLDIIDMTQTTGDRNIRVTGRLKFKATYGIGSEIVLGTSA